ncbi:MAG: GNAT family N-acetyltransferase [Actinomycetota bacterium]
MDVDAITPVGQEHLDGVLDLFAGEWWSRHRTSDDVEHIIAGSTTVGLLEHGELVAFARAISDRSQLAVVLDVIVRPSARSRGLGDRLMAEVLNLPEVRAVRSIELVCQPALFEFYARHGFTSNVGDSTLMRRTSDPALRS